MVYLGHTKLSEFAGMSPEDISEEDMVIAFMGPTGTGKSTFIDILTREKGKRAGKDLESVTHRVEATCILHPQSGKRVVLVDTPGFDDTHMTELEVLELLASWLENTYKLNIKLFGIVYLHSIADRRMKGSPIKNLRMFERLCGDSGMASVVFTTTMWQDVNTEDGEERANQLISKFWHPMIKKGATFDRLATPNYADAWRVIDDLIKKRTEISREALLLQVELVDLERKLNETEAGKELYANLKELLRRARIQRKAIRATQKALNDPKALKELEDQLKDFEARIKKAGNEAAKMKISFRRRFRKFFAFGK